MHRALWITPLWITQWLLACIFLFAGIAKLVVPIQPMVDQTGLSANLLRFVAVMEILGGLGMVVPGLLHTLTKLTPIAALGLIVIMIGATTITLRIGPALLALLPFATGVAAAFVAYGRWREAPRA
jgi:uncharacterized membrane protein YphA (DoxX/SURF4 family)